MNLRSNPLLWSFGLGTWFGTRVRVSWLLLVVAAPLLVQMEWAMGSTFIAIMFCSVLIHEFTHVCTARLLGSTADEVLLWPLGGLVWSGTGSSSKRQALIAAAGPLANLLICLALLHPVLNSGKIAAIFNPLLLPIDKKDFLLHLTANAVVLTFWFNWVSLLVNLIPAAPLDGGQISRSLFVGRLGGAMGTETSIRLALVSGAAMALSSLFVNHVFLLGVAFMAIIVAVLEGAQLQMSETPDDSFMGYDFSQGYTSLERAEDREDAPPRKSFFVRWKEKRKEARDLREAELQAAAARVLDELLAKVHQQGLGSLTDAERLMLQQASERYRKSQTGD